MSLRKRLSLVAAAAVGVAILIAAGVCYLVVRGQLLGQVDSALRGQAVLVHQDGNFGLTSPIPGPPPSAGGRAPYAQVIATTGSVLINRGGLTLPVDSAARNVASGQLSNTLHDVTAGGVHLRVYTFHGTAELRGPADTTGQFEPVAVQLARPLASVDHVLSHLRLILALLIVGGIALAAALGRIAARRVLAPLAEVAHTAQQIGETDDLSHRLRIHADDEVGQLATRFNHMLERLESSRAELDDSVRAQRQLVADASHELRTPVTSLRTNIEVLLAGAELNEEERRRLLTDVVEQSEELSALVGDLIELARGDLPAESAEDLRLDRVVAESLARSRRNSPTIQFEARLASVVIEGVPERIGRAVNNLLDNAARHSPPGGTVEVTVDLAGVHVRDHGPGIDEQDLPYVFDRFFRGANSRGKQGSGLGLAIVRQVAEQHHGSVTAENAVGGGAMFWIRLPTMAEEQDGGSGKDPGAGEPLPSLPSLAGN